MFINTFRRLAGPFLLLIGAIASAQTVPPQTYTFTVTDTNGYADIAQTYILLAATAPASGLVTSVVPSACYLEYVQSSNTVFLASDSGSSFGSGAVVGSGTTVSNSQCSVTGSNVTVTNSGNVQTFTIIYNFTSTFVGSQFASLQTIQTTAFGIGTPTAGNTYSGWNALSTIVIPPVTAPFQVTFVPVGAAVTAGITGITGDVTATGSGIVSSTVSKINGVTLPTDGDLTISTGAGGIASSGIVAGSIPQNCIAASGSSTAYTCPTAKTFTPVAGSQIVFKADVASGTSPTLAVNGAAAAAMVFRVGTSVVALDASSLSAGQWVNATYNGTSWEVQQRAIPVQAISSTPALAGSDFYNTSYIAVPNTQSILDMYPGRFHGYSTSVWTPLDQPTTNAFGVAWNGDSWTACYGLTNCTYGFADDVTYYNGWSQSNLAVSGTTCPTGGPQVFGGSYDSYQIEYIEWGINDMRLYGTSILNTDYSRCMLADAVWNTTGGTLTYGGAATATNWSTVQLYYRFNGLTTTTQNAPVVYHLAGDVIYVSYQGVASSTATFSVQIDSTTYSGYSVGPTNNTYCNPCQQALRFAGIGKGYHTVTINKTDSGAGALTLIYLSSNFSPTNFPTGAPYWFQREYVIGVGRMTAAGYVANGGSDAIVFAYDSTLQNLVSTLAQDGLDAQFIDTNATYDPNVPSSVQADGLHPAFNVNGQQAIARNLIDQANGGVSPRDREQAQFGQPLLPTQAATFTAGTNVTSVTCTSQTDDGNTICDANGGSLSIVGGTATTGTIATINWNLFTAPKVCWISQNGSATSYGLGHGTPSTTGMTITAAVSIVSATVAVDYTCTR